MTALSTPESPSCSTLTSTFDLSVELAHTDHRSLWNAEVDVQRVAGARGSNRCATASLSGRSPESPRRSSRPEPQDERQLSLACANRRTVAGSPLRLSGATAAQRLRRRRLRACAAVASPSAASRFAAATRSARATRLLRTRPLADTSHASAPWRRNGDRLLGVTTMRARVRENLGRTVRLRPRGARPAAGRIAARVEATQARAVPRAERRADAPGAGRVLLRPRSSGRRTARSPGRRGRRQPRAASTARGDRAARAASEERTRVVPGNGQRIARGHAQCARPRAEFARGGLTAPSGTRRPSFARPSARKPYLRHADGRASCERAER